MLPSSLPKTRVTPSHTSATNAIPRTITLAWANTGTRVLYVLVLVVGVVIIDSRFVGAGQEVSSESAARLRVIAGIVVLWLLGCGAGIAFRLLR